MTVPTTPLKLPIQGKPLDEDGNWTPTWARTLQLLFNRVGSYTAPSNLQLAGAIGSFIAGPASAVDSNIVVFDGVTGKLAKDGGKNIASLAPILSPAFTGVPTAPTAVPGTATTQLATTGFVGGAVFGLGNVFGPAVSVNNNITVFNGVTGKLISDSGVQISALAQLASPALTGMPTAPTATAGATTTQLATTAFVGTAVASLAPIASPAFTGVPLAPTAAAGTNTIQLATTAFVNAAFGTPSTFSAHNNGVSQSVPASAFTLINLSTAVYNTGANFAASAWTPPAGKLVMITGGVYFASTAGGSITVTIFKNGVEYKRGSNFVPAGPNNSTFGVSCMDIPNGTDVYDMRVYQATGAAQPTNGGTSLTYLQGTTISI